MASEGNDCKIQHLKKDKFSREGRLPVLIMSSEWGLAIARNLV